MTLEPTIYWTLARQMTAGPDLTLLDWLSSNELARLERIKFPARRNDWLAGRWAAKQLLRRVDPDAASHPLASIEVGNDDQGAPYLMVDGKLWPGLLSLSHRAGSVFCALAHGDMAGLGVDLERVEPREQALVDDFFTEGEAEAVSLCGDTRREVWIPLIWSAKEAILKALGAGLRIDTRQVELFPMLGNSPAYAAGWQVWWGCCSRLAGGVAEVLWQQRSEDVLTLVVLKDSDQLSPRIIEIHLSA